MPPPTDGADPGPDTLRGPTTALLRRRGWLLVVLGLLSVAAVLVIVTDIGVLTVVGALLLGLLVMRVGWFLLQQLATPPPPPPDPGTLRKVRLTYRCGVCGAEVRMTSAASDDPEAPRHCMEEMDLVGTADDAL